MQRRYFAGFIVVPLDCCSVSLVKAGVTVNFILLSRLSASSSSSQNVFTSFKGSLLPDMICLPALVVTREKKRKRKIKIKKKKFKGRNCNLHRDQRTGTLAVC